MSSWPASLPVVLRKRHCLLLACSLLTGASACFNDKGPQGDTDSGSADSATSGGATEPTGTGGDPALVELCTEGLTRRQAIAAAQCQCRVDQGEYPDVAKCLAETGAKTTAPACACDIYSEFAETKAGLECTAPAEEAVLACLDGVSCAADPTDFTTCVDTYYTGISTCAAAPKAVTAQVAVQCDMVAAYTCGSGEQIPETWECNLAADCMDASDEATCDGTFMCKDGAFIDAELTCDAFKDCADGSDEQGCPTFMCTNGTVILLDLRCDEYPDCCPGVEDPEMCADKSDEANCPTFMCMDGSTVPLRFKCDGFDDCADKSDELGCRS